MALTSPGVEVSVINESFYVPSDAGTTPLFIVASSQDKTPGSGSGTASGTTTANANTAYLISSQRELTETFGDPKFYTDVSGNSLHGYELNEWTFKGAFEKVKRGVEAVKNMSIGFFEKISGFVNKLKDWALGLSSSFDSKMPTGKNPTAYQIKLLNQVLVEDGRLKHGQLLNEAKITCDGINECLKTTNQAGAQKIVKDTNRGIADIQGMFYGKDLMAFSGEGFISENSYTQKKGKNSWTFGEIIKIFANATAIDAFNEMMTKHKDGDLSKIVEEQIDLAREIYFGKTQLPLFKVYGALKPDDTDTVERLGTAKEFTASERGKITGKGTGFQWPVVGFSCTNQKKYYNVEGILLTGADETSNEPTFTQCRMGTNKADAFSFVFEGTGILKWDKFKKKYGI